MAYNLVIVESASKSKTIQKYLNESALGGVFKVVACFGHIIDLPLKTLGVNTRTWEIDYTPIDQKKKVIAQLKGLVKEAAMVYLAADPDREGEAIAWNLKNHLKLKAGGYKRITFHEITPRAIAEAMAAPRDLDIALINAQEARRALDRVVGYKVSPLLWKRFSSSGLSAGRVQSALLAEIVWRFKEFQEHQAEPFWTVAGYFNLNETALTTHLYEKKASHKMEFKGAGEGAGRRADEGVVAVLNALIANGKDWKLVFEKKVSKQNPSAPYTTSALQQEAYEKYKIPAKQTMSYAQELYEKGLITYMRTDSVNLSADAKIAVHQYLSDAFDASYVVDRAFKSKVANAQEAHECIRPTNFSKTGLDAEAFTPGHCKVYDLIWRRSVASQMPAAEHMNYHFTLGNDSFPYEFRGKVSFVQTLGYLEIWQPSQKLETEQIALWDKLAASGVGAAITLVKAVGEANITRPTGLYNEPMLIKWMEKEGIGRPSTYSAILEKLFQKGYITKGCAPTSVIQLQKYTLNAKTKKIKTEEEAVTVGGNGKEKDKFIPTSLGERIVDYLKEILPSLLDKDFTSHMEEDLDKISRSESTKVAILSEFYKDFEVGLVAAADARVAAVATASGVAVATASGVAVATEERPPVEIIQTRYGPAIFISATKKYISVTPFMEWKKLNHVGEITEKDIEFMCQLPQKYKDIKVEMGRYGLYLVYKKKNCRLPVEEWDAVYHQTITHKTLLTFIRE